MDRARGTEGTVGGRKPQRLVWFQCGLLASLLAPLVACAGASPPDPGYAGPPQDSLAAVIRNLRAGEDALAVVDAVAAAARIAPEHLGGNLRDAMTHALALSINAEDNVLADLGSVLEEALGAAWSQKELAATMREIPSEMGLPTPRQRVAARLANRLDAGEADDDLRAAMAEAFTSIGGDHYPMHGVRDEVAAAWAKHYSAEELAGFIRSIATGTERPEQAAAVDVVYYSSFPHFSRYWQNPPAGVDSTGVTHPGLRAAVADALGYTNEIENRRKREHDRLEALGDRAGLDSLWAQERRRSWPSRNLRRTLARVVWGMRDPATIRLLAEARGDGHSLSVFGGGAVSPILAALTDVHAYRDQITALLRDMARIATQGELPVESRDATARAVQGFLGGETLRTMQIADTHGIVLSAAIDLAIALGDSASLRTVRSLAADPAEMIRAGVAARDAEVLVADVRQKIGWTPPARSQAEIAAELRTVPLSARATVSQMEAAMLAAQIDPDLLSDNLRSAMIEAWDHARGAVYDNDWYRVRTALEDGLRAGYTPARALTAIRAIPAREYGPEQFLAVEFARRLRENAGEDLSLAVIAALEHVNDVPVDEQSWSTSPIVSLQRNLVYTLGGLEGARGIPALARSGWGFSCNTHMTGDFSVDIARAILAAIAEPDAPPRRVSAGLNDLAVLLVGNDRTRDIPDELVEAIVAAARGYLDGTSMEGFSAVGSGLRYLIVRSAIFLAAVADEPELVALAEGLAADPAAVAALGVTEPDRIESIRDYARSRLAERPILTLGDC